MPNYDPRSKIHRTNKNGQHVGLELGITVPEPDVSIFTPNVVIVAAVGESSSWGGQKFDGYAYLPNDAALIAFRKQLEKSKTHEEYNFIVDVSLKALSQEGVEAVLAKIKENPQRPWLWTNTDYSIKPWS